MRDAGEAVDGGGARASRDGSRVGAVVAALGECAARCARLRVGHAGIAAEERGGTRLPRCVYDGAGEGIEPIRVGIFAGIHGDEPEGVDAVVRFLEGLADDPRPGAGYRLDIYPVCNPGGYEDGTRHARCGKDLNREFWIGSAEPEVRVLERELLLGAFQGLISLHTDDTSEGFYGYARGAFFTEHLIAPSLRAAEAVLPVDRRAVIDGFPAWEGVIRETFEGVLSAPPGTRPSPFEIILETPGHARSPGKEEALVIGLEAILAAYREFIAYAPDL